MPGRFVPIADEDVESVDKPVKPVRGRFAPIEDVPRSGSAGRFVSDLDREKKAEADATRAANAQATIQKAAGIGTVAGVVASPFAGGTGLSAYGRNVGALFGGGKAEPAPTDAKPAQPQAQPILQPAPTPAADRVRLQQRAAEGVRRPRITRPTPIPVDGPDSESARPVERYDIDPQLKATIEASERAGDVSREAGRLGIPETKNPTGSRITQGKSTTGAGTFGAVANPDFDPNASARKTPEELEREVRAAQDQEVLDNATVGDQMKQGIGRGVETVASTPAVVYEGAADMFDAAVSRFLPEKYADKLIPGGEYERDRDMFLALLERPAGVNVRDVREQLDKQPLAGTTADTLGAAFGSTIGFAGGGWLGQALKGGRYVAPMMMGAAVNAKQMKDEAVAFGATPEDADKAVLLSALVGTSEAVPVGRLFDKFDDAYRIAKSADRATKGSLFKAILTSGIAEAGEEATQEFAQQVGNNAIVARYIDENRPLLEGTLASAGTGGAVGFTMGLLFSALGMGKVRLESARDRKAAFDQAAAIAQQPSPEAPPVQPEPVSPQGETPPASETPEQAPQTPTEAPESPAPEPVVESAPAPEAAEQPQAQPQTEAVQDTPDAKEQAAREEMRRALDEAAAPPATTEAESDSFPYTKLVGDADTARRKRIRSELVKNKGIEYRYPNGGPRAILTPSTKPGVKLQMTYFAEDGKPSGDEEYKSVDEAVEGFASFNPAYSARLDLPDELAFEGVGEVPRRYVYQSRSRPVSPGAVPKSGMVETRPGGQHGQVVYDRPLTEKELSDYELDPVGFESPADVTAAPTPAPQEAQDAGLAREQDRRREVPDPAPQPDSPALPDAAGTQAVPPESGVVGEQGGVRGDKPDAAKLDASASRKADEEIDALTSRIRWLEEKLVEAPVKAQKQIQSNIDRATAERDKLMASIGIKSPKSAGLDAADKAKEAYDKALAEYRNYKGDDVGKMASLESKAQKAKDEFDKLAGGLRSTIDKKASEVSRAQKQPAEQTDDGGDSPRVQAVREAPAEQAQPVGSGEGPSQEGVQAEVARDDTRLASGQPHTKDLYNIVGGIGLYGESASPAEKKVADKVLDAIRDGDADTLRKISAKWVHHETKGLVQGGPKEVKAGNRVKARISLASRSWADQLSPAKAKTVEGPVQAAEEVAPSVTGVAEETIDEVRYELYKMRDGRFGVRASDAETGKNLPNPIKIYPDEARAKKHYDSLLDKARKEVAKPEAPAANKYQEAHGRYKSQNPKALVLVRDGDYYKTYGEDAETVKKTLGVGSSSEAVLPEKSIEGYLRRLIVAGHRPALVDSVETKAKTPPDKGEATPAPVKPGDTITYRRGRDTETGEVIAVTAKSIGVKDAEGKKRRVRLDQVVGSKPAETKAKAIERAPSDDYKVDTIAGKMDFDEFEAKGYQPDEVTRQDWINLQRANRRKLGQQEGGDSKNAPNAEYEAYHKDAVKRALAKGEEVDDRVLADYPDLTDKAETPKESKGIGESAQVKQPWEMRKDEWLQKSQQLRDEVATYSGANPAIDYAEAAIKDIKTARVRGSETSSYLSVTHSQPGKELSGNDLQSVRDALIAYGFDARVSESKVVADNWKGSLRGQGHRRAVSEAIARGDILSHPDYPELGKPASPAEPAKKASAQKDTKRPDTQTDSVPAFSPDLPKYSVYGVNVGGKPMYAIRSYMDSPRGGGDELHETLDQARRGAEEMRKRDKANAESRAKAEVEKKAKDDEAAKEKTDREDLDGFGDDLPAMRKGKVVKNLSGRIRLNKGQPDTIRNHVRRMVEAGDVKLEVVEEPRVKPMSRMAYFRATSSEQEAHEKRMREAGTKQTYRINGYNLGKTAYEYAEHLLAKKATGQNRTQKPTSADVSIPPARKAKDRNIKVRDDKDELIYEYYDGDKKVGRLHVRKSDPTIASVVEVDAGYRLQGVASKMYDAAGITKPSDSLTEDAYRFWLKRDPSLVEDSLYKHKDELLGKTVDGGKGEIVEVRNNYVSVKYDTGGRFPLYRKELIAKGLIPPAAQAQSESKPAYRLVDKSGKTVSEHLSERAAKDANDRAGGVHKVEAVKQRKSATESISEMAHMYDRQARKDEGGQGISAGAENINYRWKADSLRGLLRLVNDGKSPQDAGEEMKRQAREWVKTHNSRRRGDVNWQRWEGSADSTIDSAVRDLAGEASAPAAGQETKQDQPKRYEIGKSLTKEQRKKALSSVGDSYIDLNAPKVEKGENKDGDPIVGFVYDPEYLHTSDITGAKIRYYVTLPDGKMAHPSELFPEISESKAAALARDHWAKKAIESAWEASDKGLISKKDASYVNTYAYAKSAAARQKIDQILDKIKAQPAEPKGEKPAQQSYTTIPPEWHGQTLMAWKSDAAVSVPKNSAKIKGRRTLPLEHHQQLKKVHKSAKRLIGRIKELTGEWINVDGKYPHFLAPPAAVTQAKADVPDWQQDVKDAEAAKDQRLKEDRERMERGEIVYRRLSPPERDNLKTEAQSAGLSVPDYIKQHNEKAVAEYEAAQQAKQAEADAQKRLVEEAASMTDEQWDRLNETDPDKAERLAMLADTADDSQVPDWNIDELEVELTQEGPSGEQDTKTQVSPDEPRDAQSQGPEDGGGQVAATPQASQSKTTGQQLGLTGLGPEGAMDGGITGSKTGALFSAPDTRSKADDINDEFRAKQTQKDKETGEMFDAAPKRQYEHDIYQAAMKAFDAGKTLYVRTMTKHTKFTPKYRDMLRLSPNTGELQMQRGKRWETIAFDTLHDFAAQVGVKPQNLANAGQKESGKSLADKLASLADDLDKKADNLQLPGSDPRARGGSILGPMLAYRSGAIAARAAAKGITKGKALKDFVTQYINDHYPEYKEHVNKVLGKVQRILKASVKDGVISGDLAMAEAEKIAAELGEQPDAPAIETPAEKPAPEPVTRRADDADPTEPDEKPMPMAEPDPDTFSARQAQVNADREAWGKPGLQSTERRSWGLALETARQRGLPDKAMQTATAILQKPRALNDIETAGLVEAGTKLKAEHARLMREIGETDDAADLAYKTAEVGRVEQDFDILTRALFASGSEKGRALASQKLTLNMDMDLVSVLNRAKAAKGKQLSEAERGKFEDMTKQHAEYEAKIAELQKQVDELLAQRTSRKNASIRYRSMTPAQKDADLKTRVSRVAELLKAGCD